MMKGDADSRLPPLSGPEALMESGEAQSQQPSGSVRSRLANAMVGIKKEHYGRGPTAAKAWVLDEYILVVMEGGLTRNEETLLAAGKADLVRQYRLTFQETIAQTTIAAVEEITGRTVATYHSQILFEPTRAFEIFVLEPEQR